jgi:trehalose 6-phosphate synthase
MPTIGPVPLAVASNRGPVSFGYDEATGLVARRAGGGLATTLGPGVEAHGALWLASAVSDADRAAADAGIVHAEGFRLRSLVTPADEYRMYYDVVANGTLWFLHHGLWDLPRRPRFDRSWWNAWDAYVRVNHQFAVAIADQVDDGGTVLVQDFHLSLLCGELAKLRPDLRTAFFAHTPFCTPAELRVLPDEVAERILSGIAAAGACGFHTARWAAAFDACCSERLGRVPTTFVSPAAPDATELRRVAGSAACAGELEHLDRLVGDRRLIARVDRIELSKNLLRGFAAFDDLLEQRPSLRGEVVFAALVYPSREGLAEYRAYRREVESMVQAINDRWATPGWTPIILDTTDNYPRSVAALRRYDVLLVNPIRDGLNLVAKEGPLVNERDGLVALSPGAGVWDEIGHLTVEVHPFDVVGTSDALGTALDVRGPDRVAQAGALCHAAVARSPFDWFDEVLSAARRPADT